MGLAPTLAAFAAALLILALAVVLDRRPYRPGKLNFIPLMVLSLAAALILGRHLLTLLR